MDDEHITHGRPRFVAYSMKTRLPVLAGADAARLLADAEATPSLGFDARFAEILDCGETGPDASQVSLRLDAARELYRTVFRGPGSLSQPGMPPLQLPESMAAPESAAIASIGRDLARLVDRARAAGLDHVASELRVLLGHVRCEVRRLPSG